MVSRWRVSIPLLSLVVCATVVGVIRADAPAAWTDDLSAIAASDWTPARGAHLLERAGFGGTGTKRRPDADTLGDLDRTGETR